MKKRFRYWVVFLMLIILGSSLVSAAGDYQISPEGANPEKSYQIVNPYYFVHYFYLYILESYKISSRFDLNSKSEMIAKTYFNLSTARPTKVTVKDYNSGNLTCTFTIFNDGFIKVLNLRMNYFLAEQRFLTENDDYKKAYVSFEIMNGKLIPPSQKFSTEKVDSIKDNLNDLADSYIFDEVDDNDQLIEDYVKQYLKAAVKPIYYFVGTITLTQYYLSVKDFLNAKSALKQASQIIAKNINDPKELLQAKSLYSLVEEEYQVTMKLANRN